ncbi:hypothetical protein IAT38_008311 [Cryptococcus sp. DSM 104549]
MPVSSRKVEQAYRLLAEREAYRAQCSQLNSSRPSPEQVFYSVRNSVKHRYDNRYGNIYAYDRTAVVVDGEYLNANVVTDGKGGQWIAAQAPTPRTFDTFFKALYSGVALGKVPKTAILVQLTSWTESGVVKADPYISAGVGRTGAFIALSSLRTPGLPPPVRAPIPPLPKQLENDVIARTVDTIRECRGMLVQNPSQLDLLYVVAGRLEASGGKKEGTDRCAISKKVFPRGSYRRASGPLWYGDL